MTPDEQTTQPKGEPSPMSEIQVKTADPLIAQCRKAIEVIRDANDQDNAWEDGFQAGMAAGILEGIIAELQRREKELTLSPMDLGVEAMLPNAFLELGPEGMKLGSLEDEEDESLDEWAERQRKAKS